MGTESITEGDKEEYKNTFLLGNIEETKSRTLNMRFEYESTKDITKNA